MPRNRGIASDQDEIEVGAVGDDASVGVQGRYALHIDSICRTAVYVTRSYGGVGGGSREASPYPKYAAGKSSLDISYMV